MVTKENEIKINDERKINTDNYFDQESFLTSSTQTLRVSNSCGLAKAESSFQSYQNKTDKTDQKKERIPVKTTTESSICLSLFDNKIFLQDNSQMEISRNKEGIKCPGDQRFTGTSFGSLPSFDFDFSWDLSFGSESPFQY